MAKGTIRRLMDRGFGFIKPEDGEDLFFHSSDVAGVEFNSLSEGQEVEFEKGQGRDGRPRAVNVKLAVAGAATETQDETKVDDSGDDKGDDDKVDDSGDDKGDDDKVDDSGDDKGDDDKVDDSGDDS